FHDDDPASLNLSSETAGGDVSGYRESRQLFGRNFDFLYGQLRIRSQVVGLFSISLPSNFISSAGATARWGMAVLFGFLTVAALGLWLVIARVVTTPLLHLVDMARAVTDGDLTARSEVESSDEVGMLAGSFNTMTERLSRQHLSTIRALTSAIDARDPYT